ncbi:hypothetical protein SAMN06269250_4514 [Spirosoma fluviale]|uniref:Uncharacterized protein n=2 Tax=Spirosoma fluviale TaxID=1597977 RepID=A0A286GDB3_9BACT|nr:hypothetical protein SAMN06269250_4514 [Spirosoma fluviale]
MVWAVASAENKIGLVFYAIVLAAFFVVVIYYRDSLACVLKLEDHKLKVDYVFPPKEDLSIDLFKIQSNIVLRRYQGQYFAGGLPAWPDYWNYKWYFASERYELEFLYDGKLETLSFQVNIINFRKFLNSLIANINALNTYKIQSIDNNFSKGELAVELSTMIIKLVIAN